MSVHVYYTQIPNPDAHAAAYQVLLQALPQHLQAALTRYTDLQERGLRIVGKALLKLVIGQHNDL